MEFVDGPTWEHTKAEIAARGSVNRDFPIPDDPQWSLLTDRSKAWAYTYTQSGGDTRKANEAGRFSTPAHLTARRFLVEETPPAQRMRTFIAALNESLKNAPYEESVGGGGVAEAPPSGSEPPILATSTMEVSRPSPPSPEIVTQPPIYVPSLIPSEIVDVNEGEKDTEKAKKIWRNAASHTPGDFMILERDETNAVVDWRWDLEALQNAPAGVLKGLGRDGKGRTTVEFTDATQSAKLLADHWKPKEQESGRVDIRNVIVNILQQGQPDARYRLDQLAKEAGERLKADREKRQLTG